MAKRMLLIQKKMSKTINRKEILMHKIKEQRKSLIFQKLKWERNILPIPFQKLKIYFESKSTKERRKKSQVERSIDLTLWCTGIYFNYMHTYLLTCSFTECDSCLHCFGQLIVWKVDAELPMVRKKINKRKKEKWQWN